MWPVCTAPSCSRRRMGSSSTSNASLSWLGRPLGKPDDCLMMQSCVGTCARGKTGPASCTSTAVTLTSCRRPIESLPWRKMVGLFGILETDVRFYFVGLLILHTLILSPALDAQAPHDLQQQSWAEASLLPRVDKVKLSHRGGNGVTTHEQPCLLNDKNLLYLLVVTGLSLRRSSGFQIPVSQAGYYCRQIHTSR